MTDAFTEGARLAILDTLNKQRDGRLNENILEAELSQAGYTRSRDWLRTQLRKMEDLGAVRLTQAGDLLIAALTVDGRDHFERNSNIDGIASRSRAN